MRAILAGIAGLVMLLSAVAHGWAGWGAMRGALTQTQAPVELVGQLGAGWLFGSTAMAACGTMVIVAATRLRRGDCSGAFVLRLVGAMYFVYGLAAFVARGYEPFFLHFAVVGVLAGAPVIGRDVTYERAS